jgi:hypothetical protein
MDKYNFLKLEIIIDELIWIQDEKGEGFSGLFKEHDSIIKEFSFLNYSNGKIEKREIEKMQRIERINK